MQKWQADLLLTMNAAFECSTRICLNQGTCLNIAGFSEQYHPRKQGRNDEVCVCDGQYFGPNCEFDENDLIDSDRSRRSLDVSSDASKVSDLVDFESMANKKTDIIDDKNQDEVSFELKWVLLTHFLFGILIFIFAKFLIRRCRYQRINAVNNQ